MATKKEDASEEKGGTQQAPDKEPGKKRGRPKGSKDSKPRKKKTSSKKKSSKKAASEKKAGASGSKESGPAEAGAPESSPSSRGQTPDVRGAEEQGKPSGMKIEPDASSGEQPHWSEGVEGDRDLSVPPDILLQKKRKPEPGSRPEPEVEDILEEPEMEMPEEPASQKMVHPPAKHGLYRKLAIAFAVPVLILLLLVGYVTYSRATVTVHPQRKTVEAQQVVIVSEDPEGSSEVPGEVHEITVGGEKTGFPSDSTKSEGIAEGFATLVNDTNRDYTLVATTRLLSPEGVLFRLRDQTTIPANSEVTTEVYADEEGESGDIGPAEFIIPGLREETQEVVYAYSNEKMTGGVIAQGVATEEDISRIEEELRMDLVNEAKEELATRIEGTWTGQAFETDTMSRFVNVVAGEETDNIVVRLSLRVRSVSFDRAAALDAVVEDLKRDLTSDRELVSVGGDSADIDIERAEPEESEAAVRVTLTGESSVTLGSPLFDAEKLTGLDLDAVQAYFESIEGVERIDVSFRPFWIKRMPDLADHIEFEIMQ